MATATLLGEGWSAVTHTEIARRSGYSKATVYAHWPTTFDLIRDVVVHICEPTTGPSRVGDLRRDLNKALKRFAETLVDGKYDRLMAGAIEHAGREEGGDDLRGLLYGHATNEIRLILTAHLAPDRVKPSTTMLVGAVLVRAAYEGEPVTQDFLSYTIDRVLG